MLARRLDIHRPSAWYRNLMPLSLSFPSLSSSRNGGGRGLGTFGRSPTTPHSEIAPSRPSLVLTTTLQRRDSSGANNSLINWLVQVAAIIQLPLREDSCASTLHSANVTEHGQVPVTNRSIPAASIINAVYSRIVGTGKNSPCLTSADGIPTGTTQGVLRKARPRSLHVRGKSELLGRCVGLRIRAKNERNLGGMICAKLWVSLRVREGSVEVVTPGGYTNGSCCIGPECCGLRIVSEF